MSGLIVYKDPINTMSPKALYTNVYLALCSQIIITQLVSIIFPRCHS